MQWMLEWSSYPKIRSGSGYPERPNVFAIAGSVVHGAVEVILTALQSRGCESVMDADAVGVMRELGGFSAVIEAQCDNQLDRLADNPRARPLIEGIEGKLQNLKPDLRRRTQSILNKIAIPPRVPSGSKGQSGQVNISSKDAVYSEVDLVAEELGLRGRVDLLRIDAGACSIIDFKTGNASDRHIDQLRIYELLWNEDQSINPARIPVSSLELIYPETEQYVDPLAEEQAKAFKTTLAERIDSAEEEIARRPPHAAPAPEKCSICDVRQMCDEFWADHGLRSDPWEVELGSIIDCEFSVVQQRGPRSWDVLCNDGQAILRTRREGDQFAPADRVRALRLVVGGDAGRDALALTESAFTEMFVLAT